MNHTGEKQNAKEKFLRELLQGLRDRKDEKGNATRNIYVSETEIRDYIKRKKKAIPKELGGLDGVIQALSEKCDYRYRRENSNRLLERYIRIKEEKLSTEIRKEVERLVIYSFAGRERVSSSEFGNKLRSHGIDFHTLGYADLTDFVREFDEFIIIDAKLRGDGNADISYCFNPIGLKNLIEKHGTIIEEVRVTRAS